jgi:hypothetical protein
MKTRLLFGLERRGVAFADGTPEIKDDEAFV